MAQISPVNDSLWVLGANSLIEPGALRPGEYQWGTNIINRGGLIATRPGFALVGQMLQGLGEPQAITFFQPRELKAQLIVAVGGKILKSDYPFRTWQIVPGLTFNKTGQIVFCAGLKSVEQSEDGLLTPVEASPILIIQDGVHKPGIWDGASARYSNPAPTPAAYEVPIGKWMAWAGNRLWVAQGNKLFASNIADPTKFSETGFLSGGGYFNLPDEITGIGQTPDLRTLLVGTASTLTSFLSNIRDRTQWEQTPDFQKVLLPGIGVTAGKSFVNQYGLTWWYSADGVMGLDNALQSYKSSRIHVRDQNMMRSKANMSRDKTGICAGTFENLLCFSVPSGGINNAHTWVMDQAPIDTNESPGDPAWTGAWTGLRPVEWVTPVVNGHARCFLLSHDKIPGTTKVQYNVWEGFVPKRRDVNHNSRGKRIQCSVETRRYSQSPQLLRFLYAQLDLTEIAGIVNIAVYYAGMRGAYKKIMQTTVVASEGSIGGLPSWFLNKNTRVQPYKPQERILRTQQASGGRDGDGIEGRYNRDVDKGFSLRVVWTGQMSIRSIQGFFEVMPDEMTGACELDESTKRAVAQNGIGYTSTDLEIVTPVVNSGQSAYVRALTPRYAEENYLSLIDGAPQVADPNPYSVLVPPIIAQAPKPVYTTYVTPPVTIQPVPAVPVDSSPPNPRKVPVDTIAPRSPPNRLPH